MQSLYFSEKSFQNDSNHPKTPKMIFIDSNKCNRFISARKAFKMIQNDSNHPKTPKMIFIDSNKCNHFISARKAFKMIQIIQKHQKRFFLTQTNAIALFQREKLLK